MMSQSQEYISIPADEETRWAEDGRLPSRAAKTNSVTESMRQRAPTSRRSAQSLLHDVRDETNEISDEKDQDPDDPGLRKAFQWLRRRGATGWYFGVQMAAVSTATVLAINLVLTAWAAARFPLDDGIGTAYTGSCKVVNNCSRWLHIVINILSSIVLAMSNYCMQCLSSPTRAEIDKTHAKGDWLDVGVISLRNLSRIHWTRTATWILLAISSIPMHLLYNSAIFKVQENSTYNAMIVTPSLFTSPGHNRTWGVPSPFRDDDKKEVQHVLQATSDGQYNDPTKFLNQSKAECMAYYEIEYISGRRTLLIVTEAWRDIHNDSTAEASMATGILDMSFFYNQSSGSNISSTIFGENEGAHRNPGDWNIMGVPITYCMSELEPEKCQLQFSLHILAIIVAFNTLKIAAMVATLLLHKKSTPPLVTIGDAISSFLEHPDARTRGMCLDSRYEIVEELKQSGPQRAREFAGKRSHWWKAASAKRRFSSILAQFLVWCVSVVLLAAAIQSLRARSASFNSSAGLWQFGFGNPNPYTTIGTALPKNGAGGLISAALLANLPQALFSLLNLAYNSLFTCMLLGHEWSRYATRHRGLRVSVPREEQRSTYWLQMPYRYSIPMLVIWSFIHWIISQSFFLVRIANYAGGQLMTVESGAGFSGVPMIFFVAVDGVMVLVIFWFGNRKFCISRADRREL